MTLQFSLVSLNLTIRHFDVASDLITLNYIFLLPGFPGDNLKEVAKVAMHYCDKSMSLLLGSQMSLGTLRGNYWKTCSYFVVEFFSHADFCSLIDIVSQVEDDVENMPGKFRAESNE